MQFLKQQNERIGNAAFAAEDILASGKNVIVIGGGDTGSDCVGTSHRHGAKTVTQFELLAKPPIDRTSLMPWPNYPMLLKTSTSHEEGGDRKWGIATKEFIGDKSGDLKAVKVADVEWTINEDGSLKNFVELPGSEREMPCQLALLAMGFLYPEKKGLITDLKLRAGCPRKRKN
jgi:glutamate synthase (NADPH/NADH) small chain